MIKPLPGWILIEPMEEDQTTESGLVMPDSTQDFPMKGKILGVGRGITQGKMEILRETSKEEHWVWDDPPVKIDEIVYFKKFSGQEIKHDGKTFKLVEFKDLLAILE